MTPEMKRIFEQRAKLFEQSRTMLKTAETEKRSLTAEETANYDKIINDIEDLGAHITRLEASEKRVAEFGRSVETPISHGTHPGGVEKPKHGYDSDEQRSAWQKYMIYGQKGLMTLSEPERRAMTIGKDVQGGFLQAPTKWVADLIKDIDNAVPLRGMATVIPVAAAQSLGCPTLDTDLADDDWTTEIADATEDDAMRLGGRELHPHPATKLVKISKTLLRAPLIIPADTLVRQRLSYIASITQEKGFMTGTGDKQPLGLFTASAAGISTGQDVSTDNTTTSPTFDGLMNALYTLKSGYLVKASWIVSRKFIQTISKLKDGTGAYIWQPNVQQGAAPSILGKPYVVSEYVPNTFTTGLYVAILGDCSYYWIADALDLAVQVLEELYAISNQNGYLTRFECDGMPINEKAFVRVKLA